MVFFGLLAFFGSVFVLTPLYNILFESSAQQATPGKMALGLKVTDMQGRRLSFGRAVGQALARILSEAINGLGYIIAAFTEKKQTLHDLIAGTLVVKGEPEIVPVSEPARPAF